jgi:hypothetical protein
MNSGERYDVYQRGWPTLSQRAANKRLPPAQFRQPVGPGCRGSQPKSAPMYYRCVVGMSAGVDDKRFPKEWVK